jgi:DNA-binding winged helix-turn-helix (wHTH) protein
MPVRFNEFVLDTTTRELLRAGERVHLSPKAYELLATLVESRPKALAKAELRDRLWPNTFVVEANLSNLVGEIRAALGEDSRRPRFIRTVQGFGYAFEGRETDSPAPLRCGYRLNWSGGRADLAEGEHVLGRDPDVSICIESTTVSRRHARLRIEAGEATLEDLGSKNGTFVNDHRIEAPTLLARGDQIRLGSMRLEIRRLGRVPSTETAAR